MNTDEREERLKRIRHEAAQADPGGDAATRINAALKCAEVAIRSLTLDQVTEKQEREK